MHEFMIKLGMPVCSVKLVRDKPIKPIKVRSIGVGHCPYMVQVTLLYHFLYVPN